MNWQRYKIHYRVGRETDNYYIAFSGDMDDEKTRAHLQWLTERLTGRLTQETETEVPLP